MNGAATDTVSVKTGYAPVNGLRMYYEIRGEGTPLILVHGGVVSTEDFAGILPALLPGRQVIAVDLQAHDAQQTSTGHYGTNHLATISRR